MLRLPRAPTDRGCPRAPDCQGVAGDVGEGLTKEEIKSEQEILGHVWDMTVEESCLAPSLSIGKTGYGPRRKSTTVSEEQRSVAIGDTQ